MQQCSYTTIQSAIDNANGSGCRATPIYITSENPPTNSYVSQALTISAKNVLLIGSANTDCSGNVIGSGSQTIALSGNGLDPVLTISGGSVTLTNLDISGGMGSGIGVANGGGGIKDDSSGGSLTLNGVDVHGNSAAYGGGVSFYGDGTLTLNGATIDSNTAGAGGGISAVSSATGHVELVIDDNASASTEIAQNQTTGNGGGIYAEGDVHLLAVSAAPGAISIHNNLAGAGGGIYFSGTAYADIGLPGSGIDANQAYDGAGIFVGPDTTGNAVLRLFSTDAEDPTRLAYNGNGYVGGGLMIGAAGASTHATACVFDSAIVDNTASQAGTAIDVGDGGRLIVNPDSDADCSFAAVAALGAVQCDPANSFCNLVGANESIPGGMNDAPAAIDFTGAAQLAVRRIRIAGNAGNYVIHGSAASGASVAFSECLLNGNSTVDQLVSVQGAAVSFDGCTFADDSIGGNPVFYDDTGLSLTRSIVRETTEVWSSVAGLTAHYLILNEPLLSADDTVVFADPAFVDAAGGDYHLQVASPAIDYAPTGSETGSTDLDGVPRETDLPSIANQFGYRDLGAYERQNLFFECGASDSIYCDGFDH